MRIKLKLCNIYRNRGMLDDFVDVIFPLIRESLYVATLRQKVIFVKLIFKHAHTLFHQFTESQTWCSQTLPCTCTLSPNIHMLIN